MFLSDTVQRERGQRQSIESKIDIVLCLVVLPKEDQMDKDVIVSNVKPPYTLGFPYGSPIHPQCRRCRRNELNPWVGKIPWRRQWQLTPVFLPGKFQGQRSLTGYSTWDHRVRHDCTWAHVHTHTHTCLLLLLYIFIPERYFYVICGMYIYILPVTSLSFESISVSYFLSKL